MLWLNGESGEVTYEPLTLISKDDPITCAGLCQET